jgi:hypothetical protein
MPQARPLGAKLYLEGIEVPFVGATITTQVGAASIAYIDLVPHHTITDIKPRTHVLLTVRDYHNKAENYPFVNAWEGEVFGYSFNKTPASRTFSISCIDYTSYWDNVLTYFFNTQVSLGKGVDILEVGMDYTSSKEQGVTPVSIGHSLVSYMRQVINDKINEGGGNDFLDGFIAVIEKIGGINDFYSAAEARLKIKERIALRSSGQLPKLLQEKEALDWFNSVIGGESGFSTLRQVINDLCSIIFHDSVTLAFPSAITDTTTSGNTTTTQIKEMKQFIFKPNLFTIPPPACNIFFPDEYSSFTYNRQFLREPTRLIYKPELPLQDGQIPLPHTYSPDSFNGFMMKKDVNVGTGDLDAPKDPGHYGDGVVGTGPEADFSKKKREWAFMTNEELMKGILLAMENMVPATDEFRASLSDPQRGDFADKVAKYLFYKKRFQTREFQITGHLKLSVVPGFNGLVLDNSASGQNILAYVTGVTHRFYATEGGYTTATFAFARTAQEQEATSTKGNDPLIPPWFDATIFGTNTPTSVPKDKQETVGANISEANYVGSAGKKLSEFYQDLLGGKGYTAVTDMYPGYPTVVGAVGALLDEYIKYKEKPGADILDFIGSKTDRSYVRVRDAFNFIGAKLSGSSDLRTSTFTEFVGGAFEPSGKTDSMQISTRKSIVKLYRDALKAQRAFKG